MGPFHMGPGTLRVRMALHAANRANLAALLLAAIGGKDRGDVILLQGADQAERYDTDNEPLFRQESYFHYLFGVSEGGCYGAVRVSDGAATLFVPQYGRDYEIFCGRFPAPSEFMSKYEVAHALPVGELVPWLEKHLAAHGDARVHVFQGTNSDSGAAFPRVALPTASPAIEARMDGAVLYSRAANARAHKSAHELELMRYAYWVSSMAHVDVMRATRPGMMEFELESLFLHRCYANGGCRHAAYTSICASGPNAAVLHYGHAGRPNDRQLRDGDMVLLDMGAEYHCYASDITNSYPVSGTFTSDQRVIWEAVQAAQLAVATAAGPGVAWPDMHRLAERTILSGLRDAGIVTGDVDAMLAADLGAVFMPHGLGHLIGIDTHDVGGYLPGGPPRSMRPGLRKLRTARILEEGMVITVEPGCYFIDVLLDDALADEARAPFLVRERVDAFRGFGGVRIEDAVLCTANGVESLTMCPRSVAEVEHVIAGGAWPPKHDAVPGLKRQWCVLAADGLHMQRFEIPPAAAP